MAIGRFFSVGAARNEEEKAEFTGILELANADKIKSNSANYFFNLANTVTGFAISDFEYSYRYTSQLLEMSQQHPEELRILY